MAQGLNSTKSAARPSHEAIEDETTANESNKSNQERMDHAAMQSAKRAQNRKTLVGSGELSPLEVNSGCSGWENRSVDSINFVLKRYGSAPYVASEGEGGDRFASSFVRGSRATGWHRWHETA